MSLRLYVWQRLSAGVMVPLIVIHIVTIFLATGAGLSAADILARTQGSILWGGFYTIFVCAAALHGSIGLRAVLTDWTSLSGQTRDVIMWAFAIVLLLAGLRAVAAVVLV